MELNLANVFESNFTLNNLPKNTILDLKKFVTNENLRKSISKI